MRAIFKIFETNYSFKVFSIFKNTFTIFSKLWHVEIGYKKRWPTSYLAVLSWQCVQILPAKPNPTHRLQYQIFQKWKLVKGSCIRGNEKQPDYGNTKQYVEIKNMLRFNIRYLWFEHLADFPGCSRLKVTC
jgi:hypothetical protein